MAVLTVKERLFVIGKFLSVISAMVALSVCTVCVKLPDRSGSRQIWFRVVPERSVSECLSY